MPEYGRAYSRYVQTPRHLIIELNASGADYLLRTNETGTPLVQTWPEVHHILSRAKYKFSQQEREPLSILALVPPSVAAPH
jgi:hypothetical protein